MRNKRHDAKWWLIVVLLNILLVEYPAGLYLRAADDSSRVIAAVILAGVTLVLSIADFFTILLAVFE